MQLNEKRNVDIWIIKSENKPKPKKNTYKTHTNTCIDF